MRAQLGFSAPGAGLGDAVFFIRRRKPLAVVPFRTLHRGTIWYRSLDCPGHECPDLFGTEEETAMKTAARSLMQPSPAGTFSLSLEPRLLDLRQPAARSLNRRHRAAERRRLSLKRRAPLCSTGCRWACSLLASTERRPRTGSTCRL